MVRPAVLVLSLFLGLGWSFDSERRVVTEIGYLNQFINGRTTDESNHILSINLLLSL